MLVAQSVGYIGPQLPNGYVGFLHEGNFFAVLSIEEGVTQESGEKLFQSFKTELQSLQITNLSSFESHITNTVLKLNFPAHFNLAIGYVLKDVLYIKTVGNGQIYFRREKEFDLLMDGDKSASGYLQEYDMAIFTTGKINELLGAVEDIKVFVDLDPPKEINEKMLNEGYAEEAQGFSGLFVEFLSEETAELLPPPEEQVQPVTDTQVEAATITEPSATSTLIVGEKPSTTSEEEGTHPPIQPVPPAFVTPTIEPKVPEVPMTEVGVPASSVEPVVPGPVTPTIPPATPPSDNKHLPKGFSLPFLSGFQFRQSKKISMIIVVILFAVLLWSVVFGYQRRMAAEMQEKVEMTQTQIQANLTKAEEEAYLNFEGSISLIEESKELLNALKEEVGSSKEEEIARIAKLIEATEAKIVKRDEKESVEFYDLGLESEDAQGETLYLEGNTVALLDQKNNTVYILSLDSKSIDKYTSAEVGAATLVATYEDSIYFLNPQKGIYEFSTSTKAEQVIEADGWGNIVDMEIYNGNIYVLDEENNEIYKYLVTESGFSEKSSYFQGDQTVDLSNSTGMTIDSAVYIAKESSVLKFISGISDPFVTNYPEETPQLSGIFTTTDIEQVYVWDITGASIYVLSKDGGYNRQVATGVLRNAKGVFIYENDAYIFDGKKLYTVPLD